MSEADPAVALLLRQVRRRWVVLALLVALSCAACSLPAGPVGPGSAIGESRVVVYLNGPAKTPVDLGMQLMGIEAVREDGTAWPVVREAREIRSLDVVGRQVQLGEGSVPPGRYTHLVLRVGRAWLREEGKPVDLSVPAEGLRVPFRFEVVPRQATPLFLTWRVEESVERGVFLRPAFAVESRQPELRSLLAYVTNEGEGSVSVVDRAQDRVVSVIEVGQGPRGIALDPRGARVYVVNGRSDSLSVIDVKTNRLLHTINLEVQGRATDVVVTPDGRTIYVANTGLNSVSAIDAVTFQTVATIRVGNEPRALAADPQGGRVYVANTQDNTVSALDTVGQRVVATTPVEARPSALAVDEAGTRLFVGHTGSANLVVLSPADLRRLRSVPVGMGVTAVLADQAPNRVFVALQATRQILVLDTQLGVEVGRLAGTAGARQLALDPEWGKVYAVNQAGNTVGIYDRAARQLQGAIQVGRRPYGIALVR